MSLEISVEEFRRGEDLSVEGRDEMNFSEWLIRDEGKERYDSLRRRMKEYWKWKKGKDEWFRDNEDNRVLFLLGRIRMKRREEIYKSWLKRNKKWLRRVMKMGLEVFSDIDEDSYWDEFSVRFYNSEGKEYVYVEEVEKLGEGKFRRVCGFNEVNNLKGD